MLNSHHYAIFSWSATGRRPTRLWCWLVGDRSATNQNENLVGRLRSATNQKKPVVGRLRSELVGDQPVLVFRLVADRSAKVGDQLEIFPVGRRPVGYGRRPTTPGPTTRCTSTGGLGPLASTREWFQTSHGTSWDHSRRAPSGWYWSGWSATVADRSATNWENL